MAIWDAQHETIDRERLEELQLAGVSDMLARVSERADAGPAHDDIR